ncbi:MAG TPA: hypothetical protein VLA16_08010 [Ideonella sp.]|nr:hypothetical protein [Ideonella sp.]
MNVSKTLAAAIAATTIVGAVGLAFAQTTSDTPATAVIAPADTQKAATQDPSMQAPTEGSQGTQSGPGPSMDQSSAGTPAPAPVANDSTMASEPAPKADRN